MSWSSKKELKTEFIVVAAYACQAILEKLVKKFDQKGC